MKKITLFTLFVISSIVIASPPIHQGKVSITDYNDDTKQLIADFSVAADPAPGHEESYIYQGDMYLVARDSETNEHFFCYIESDDPLFNKLYNGLKRLTDGIRITARSDKNSKCILYIANFWGNSVPTPNSTNTGFIVPGSIRWAGGESNGRAYSNACNNPAPYSTDSSLCMFRSFVDSDGLIYHFDFKNTDEEGLLADGDLTPESKDLINSSNIGVGTAFIYNKTGPFGLMLNTRFIKASFIR